MKHNAAGRGLAFCLVGLVICLVGLVICLLAVAAVLTEARADTLTGRVVGVADGDTLTVLVDRTEHRVRLAEIDAPEKRQAWGERAKQSLADLCFNAEATVAVASKDRYGRSIARVRCGEHDASLYQVRAGLAWAYTQYLTDPAIAHAEAAAREARAGLWADADPVPPWLYRKGAK